MTDHFERETLRILKESRENGGLTLDHIFCALTATNEDLDDQHAETRRWHEQVAGMVAEHIAEAVVRDRRITNLEIQFEDRRKSCGPEVKKLIREEHAKTHAEYVASLQSSDFNSRLVWFFASNLGKFALVVAGILAGIILNLAVYGRP